MEETEVPVVSVRESSVVRGAVLMVIEDLWMQVRVKQELLYSCKTLKTEVTVSCVFGEIQRGPFSASYVYIYYQSMSNK